MPEIGQTLRETRLRARIDITEVEAATKIRAKYLRALENEEWDLLPGPTFVKTFLRTYADYLGLDSRMLVEEYRQRFEKPSTMDLTPFSTGLGGRRQRRRRPLITPGVALVLGVVLLLGALYALGTLWPDGGDGGEATPERAGQEEEGRRSRTSEREERSRRRERRSSGSRRSRVVRLTLVATGSVYVCLVDARGRAVVDQETLAAGDRRGPFRSRRFRANFGTGQVEMRWSGRRFDVPDTANPVGYSLRAGQRRPSRLPDDARPTCA
jgi:hypothetical protein